MARQSSASTTPAATTSTAPTGADTTAQAAATTPAAGDTTTTSPAGEAPTEAPQTPAEPPAPYEQPPAETIGSRLRKPKRLPRAGDKAPETIYAVQVGQFTDAGLRLSTVLPAGARALRIVREGKKVGPGSAARLARIDAATE